MSALRRLTEERAAPWAWRLANFAAIQAAWFACVLGAAGGSLVAAYVVCAAFLVLHLLLTRDPVADLRVAAAALAFGAIVETANRAWGVVIPAHDSLPAPWPPSWLLALWIAFALTIRHSMAWLGGRWLLGAAIGAVAGPLSLRGGERLGAVTITADPVVGWGAPAAEWAAAMPLLLFVASRATPRRAD